MKKHVKHIPAPHKPPAVLSSQSFEAKKAYKQKFEKLLGYELEAQAERTQQEYKWPKSKLVGQGIAVFELTAKRSGQVYGIPKVCFSYLGYKRHRFNAGDFVIISRTDPTHDRAFTGTVFQVFPNSIIISTTTITADLEEGFWRMDRSVDDVTHNKVLTALKQLVDSSHNSCGTSLIDVIISGQGEKIEERAAAKAVLTDTHGNKLKKNKEALVDLLETIKLNSSQMYAVKQALNRRFTLIQGPPGTGKTHTAVQLVKLFESMYKGTGLKILITCFSNAGLDNLAYGLLKAKVKVLRLGQPEKVLPEMKDCTLAAKIQKSHDSVLSEQEIIKNIFEETTVFCATCVGAAHWLLDNVTFPIVIIDEACQAYEPATLIPLTKGSQQVICIGDQNQLPPTVMSGEASQGGLAVSMFERLIKEGITPIMLTVQYRMHPGISIFPSKQFYENRLADGITAESRPPVSGFNWPDTDYPVAFVHSNSREKNANPSVSNQGEIDLVCAIVNSFLGEGVNPSSIGVISMYAEQVTRLESALKGKKVTVSSVDGFQGREMDLIIISMVRSNTHGSVGFLNDWRRFNVAVTRAKYGLIIVGNAPTIVNDPTIASWLAWVDQHELCIDESEISDSIKSHAISATSQLSDALKSTPKKRAPSTPAISESPDQVETISDEDEDEEGDSFPIESDDEIENTNAVVDADDSVEDQVQDVTEKKSSKQQASEDEEKEESSEGGSASESEKESSKSDKASSDSEDETTGKDASESEGSSGSDESAGENESSQNNNESSDIEDDTNEKDASESEDEDEESESSDEEESKHKKPTMKKPAQSVTEESSDEGESSDEDDDKESEEGSDDEKNKERESQEEELQDEDEEESQDESQEEDEEANVDTDHGDAEKVESDEEEEDKTIEFELWKKRELARIKRDKAEQKTVAKQSENKNPGHAETEKERLVKEKLQKEEKKRLEAEQEAKKKLEQERIEKERLEKERIQKEKLEKERLEKERLEKERLQKEKLDRERLEKERLDKERLEKERLQKEKLEKERLEKERLEKERLEKERLQKEKLEKERLEKELEKERLEKERIQKEKLEKEEKERIENNEEVLNQAVEKAKDKFERAKRKLHSAAKKLKEAVLAQQNHAIKTKGSADYLVVEVNPPKGKQGDSESSSDSSDSSSEDEEKVNKKKTKKIDESSNSENEGKARKKQKKTANSSEEDSDEASSSDSDEEKVIKKGSVSDSKTKRDDSAEDNDKLNKKRKVDASSEKKAATAVSAKDSEKVTKSTAKSAAPETKKPSTTSPVMSASTSAGTTTKPATTTTTTTKKKKAEASADDGSKVQLSSVIATAMLAPKPKSFNFHAIPPAPPSALSLPPLPTTAPTTKPPPSNPPKPNTKPPPAKKVEPKPAAKNSTTTSTRTTNPPPSKPLVTLLAANKAPAVPLSKSTKSPPASRPTTPPPPSTTSHTSSSTTDPNAPPHGFPYMFPPNFPFPFFPYNQQGFPQGFPHPGQHGFPHHPAAAQQGFHPQQGMMYPPFFGYPNPSIPEPK